MNGRFDVLTRGRDSSGRPVRATRQSWQRYDRINQVLGGKLIIVQGAFNRGVSASAGTHDRAGAMDFRTWNLTAAELDLGIRTGRDLGGADFYRTRAEGFDPHWHGITIGDEPMHPATAAQVRDYLNGLNALASRRADSFHYRPAVIRPYQFQEDDMFTDDDRKLLQSLEQNLRGFATEELARDQRSEARAIEREKRAKKRFSDTITALGKHVDALTVLINQTPDERTKTALRTEQAGLLTFLKDHPDVDGVDNPTDDGMASRV